MNKTLGEITSAYNKWHSKEFDLREMMHNYLSALLANTSEDNPLKCCIVLVDEKAFGLSSNDMPTIEAIWQHPIEGWIVFNMQGDYQIDFDDMLTCDLMDILHELNKLPNY